MRNAIPLLAMLCMAALNIRAAEPVKAGLIHLHTMEAAALPAEAQTNPYPLVTVGSLAQIARAVANDTLITKLAAGRHPLMSPRAGGVINFQVVTPLLNSFEFCEPVFLQRVGNDLTLRIESWKDDAQRLRNVPRRSVFFLSAYQLEAGDYTLHVQVHDLFCQSGQGRPIYLPAGVRSTSTPLTIAAADHNPNEPANAPLPLINESDLKPQPQPAAAFAAVPIIPRQHVSPILIELDQPQAQPGLRVGTFDLNAYQTAPAPAPAAGRPLPDLLPADPAATIYAIVLAPQLNSGEFLTANRVEWRDRECIVTVDLWQDDGPRRKNLLHNPLLIIPLLPAGAPVRSTWQPGEYKVALRWNTLHAPDQGGLYISRANDEFVKKTTAEATFTVK